MINIAEYITDSDKLNASTLLELRQLVDDYPYFQSARLLYLKNLYQLHHEDFGPELRKAALYITDREALFQLIEGHNYRIEPRMSAPRRSVSEGLDRTLSLIDDFLAQLPSDEAEVVASRRHAQPTAADATGDYTAYLLTLDDAEVEDEDSTPSHSSVDSAAPMRGQSLIDNFISDHAEGERIVIKDETPSEDDGFVPIETPVLDYSLDSLPDITDELEPEPEPEQPAIEEEDDSLFTEALARIYIKQHKYDKALEIIQRISLKNPEKNAYFADQIRFLRKLIINNKIQ